MRSEIEVNIEIVRGQVNKNTPEIVLKQIATQMTRADEAKRRIDEEGIVVRDMSGSVIPHPAIQIEINCVKLISELLAKNKKIAWNGK